MLNRRSMLGSLGALSAGVAFGSNQCIATESSSEGYLSELFDDMRALIPSVYETKDSIVGREDVSQKLAGVVSKRLGLRGSYFQRQSGFQKCPVNTVSNDQYLRAVCLGGSVFFAVRVADRNFGFMSVRVRVPLDRLAGKSQLGDGLISLHNCVHGSILSGQCSSDAMMIEQVRIAFEDHLSLQINDGDLPFCGRYERGPMCPYRETSIISRDGVPQIAVERLHDGVKRNVVFGQWRM